jgi:cytoskeleton protein RodZ
MNDEDFKTRLPDTDETADSQVDSLMSEEWQEKVTGLGALLKSEREKRDVSIDQITKLTRLRRHFIEALETEDWKHLPAPVFVRGFIRAYARALNLDEGKVFDLYEGTTPPDMSVPQPVAAAPAARKTSRYVVGTVALLGIIVAFYFWRADRIEQPPKTPKTERTAKKQASVEPSEQIPTDSEEEALTSIEEGVNDPDARLAALLDDIYKPVDILAEERLAQYLKTAQPASGSVLRPANTAESPAAPPTEWLTLRGIVKTRTWVRIYVDDQAPKEFIFQPGSRPQWKAKQGFSVLIGNAAGIDFEFNGEEIRALGNLGQVVRLNFPEGFVAPGLEE